MAKADEEGSGIKTLSRRSGSGFAKLLRFVERANQVARERRELMRLGDAALKDFAVSRADAVGEASRPWWDLPTDRQ